MNELILSIAGVETRITCAHEPLIRQLETRYAGFVLPEAKNPYPVTIHFDPKAKPYTYVSPECLHDHGRIKFELPGYYGLIDPDHAAVLRLASLTPSSSADYFIRVIYVLLIFQAGGLLVHSAGIIHNHCSYLFFGHSGSGKTTVAQNSSDKIILNDDLIALLPSTDGWEAFGTPFTNPTQTEPTSSHAPVKALLRLVQSPQHVFTKPLVGAEAVAELLASVPILNGSEYPPLDRCQQIIKSIPAYYLHFLPDDSFWPVVENL